MSWSMYLDGEKKFSHSMTKLTPDNESVIRERTQQSDNRHIKQHVEKYFGIKLGSSDSRLGAWLHWKYLIRVDRSL